MLDEQRKRLQKQLREIEKFSDMDQMFPGRAEREVEGRATGLRRRSTNFCLNTRRCRKFSKDAMPAG